MEGFMTKAFTPLNVQSALQKSGFNGADVDPKTILSHNYEFCALSEKQSIELLRLIDAVFVPYWWQNGVIHEFVFEGTFGGGTTKH
jgi:hypothetical protein